MRQSHHPHQLLRKKWGAVTGPRVDGLSDNLGDELLILLEKENSNAYVSRE